MVNHRSPYRANQTESEAPATRKRSRSFALLTKGRWRTLLVPLGISWHLVLPLCGIYSPKRHFEGHDDGAKDKTEACSNARPNHRS